MPNCISHKILFSILLIVNFCGYGQQPEYSNLLVKNIIGRNIKGSVIKIPIQHLNINENSIEIKSIKCSFDWAAPVYQNIIYTGKFDTIKLNISNSYGKLMNGQKRSASLVIKYKEKDVNYQKRVKLNVVFKNDSLSYQITTPDTVSYFTKSN